MRMRKLIHFLLVAMLILGSTLTFGASVSVMADDETGAVVPQSLENRFALGDAGNLIATNNPQAGQMLYANGANNRLFWGEAIKGGATQIIANVQGQSSVTGSYDSATKTLTLADLPLPEYESDSSAWSDYPAIHNVDGGGNLVSNVTDILGTDGESLLVQSDASEWSDYPATKAVNAGGNSISNVADVKGVDGQSLFRVGVESLHGVYPVVVTNIGGAYYVGMVSITGGTIIIPDVTNRTTFQYISATNQYWNVPIGVTQVFAYVWGAGGGYASYGGAGGFSYAQFPVAGGTTLTIEVGQAGATTNAVTGYAITRNAFPNGGYGVSRASYITAGGGGRSSIRNGTNYIVVAGGGGGGCSTLPAGSGGGLSGGDGGNSASSDYGRGATQTNGGVAGSVAGVHQYVATSGGFLSGGNGGCVTSVVTGAGSGGGDGWYGGGGGDIVTSASARGSGGGGSGYVNPAFTTYGYTIRGVGTVPAMTEYPYYVSGAGATENNGLIVLLY